MTDKSFEQPSKNETKKRELHGGDFYIFCTVLANTFHGLETDTATVMLKQLKIMYQEFMKQHPVPASHPKTKITGHYLKEIGVYGNPFPHKNSPPRIDTFQSLSKTLDSFSTYINTQASKALQNAYSSFLNNLALECAQKGVADIKRPIDSLPTIRIKDEALQKDVRSTLNPALVNQYS
jgi:hypothetical protein